MRFGRPVWATAGVAAASIAVGGWLLQTQGTQSVASQARLFNEVMQHISHSFVEQIPADSLYGDAIRGLLREIGDPHSEFFTPKDLAEFRIQTTGEYGGVGMRIGLVDEKVTVVDIIPSTPAERAGLRTGDQLVVIEGEPTTGWSTDRAANKLRGPVGTKVTFYVKRDLLGEPVKYEVSRQEVHVNAVTSAFKTTDGIAYIDLGSFSESAADEVEAALKEFGGSSLKGVVLDLRGNPGGLLEEAVDLADVFLPARKSVVKTKGRMAGSNRDYLTKDAADLAGVPVVVLVDRFTASAAEILAGALQDHDRGIVLGERSFGKGVAQLLFPLSSGHALKLTVERWYTPIGRQIQRPEAGVAADSLAISTDSIVRTFGGRDVAGGWGVTPDVKVAPDTTTLAERMLSQALQKSGSKFGDMLFRYSVDYAASHPKLQPGFTLGQDVLADFYNTLQRGGVEIDRDIYDRADGTVRRALELQITRMKWGENQVRMRTNLTDPQVVRAIELLQKGTTTSALLEAAAARPKG